MLLVNANIQMNSVVFCHFSKKKKKEEEEEEGGDLSRNPLGNTEPQHFRSFYKKLTSN